jgi:hypothetical protein
MHKTYIDRQCPAVTVQAVVYARHGRLRGEGSEGSPMAKVRVPKAFGIAHGRLMFLSGEIRTVAAVGASLWDADMEKSVFIFTDG